MNFEMDSQSFEDLGIFGSHKSSSSIFEIYCRTSTVGGRDKMEEMMRNPSNSLKILQERRDSIAYFLKSNISLKIDHSSFDLILHYLQFGGVLLRSNLIDSLTTHLKSKINPSQEYYNVKVGLKNLLPLLAHGEEVSEILIKSETAYLKKLGNTIKEIVEKPEIKYAINLSNAKKLNLLQLAKTDIIVRKNNVRDINKLLAVFYELDVFATLSRLYKDNDFCLPSYLDDQQGVKIEIEGLFHPALTNPVKTGISIYEKNNLMFLSGSNMSGKSSFLKSIGLAVYLSHIGFPIPAKKLTTVVFNGLISTINLADNIQNGLSHYYSEVMRVRKVVTLLTKRKKMFVLLDELFKGTNSKDAFDGSLLVINGFAEIENSIFIISSHITELAPQLKQKNINLSYLEHLIVDEKPEFTYQLKQGVAKDGIGMYFIENENIRALLDQAKITSTTST